MNKSTHIINSSVVAKRHLKFVDDEADDSFHTADEGHTTLDAVESSSGQKISKNNAVSESESESDDDAPEEIDVGTSKNALEETIKAQEQAIYNEKKLQKEKRKLQQKFFQQQQLLKKSKKDAESGRLIESETNLKSDKFDVGSQDDLQELPEEFFAELDNTENSSTTQVKSKHINFDDSETEFSKDDGSQNKNQKQKTLKELRKMQVRKGPVVVSMLSSIRDTKTLAPKRENSVLKARDKWLKRRALKRR